MADEPIRNYAVVAFNLPRLSARTGWPARIRQCPPRLGAHINVKDRSIDNLLEGSTNIDRKEVTGEGSLFARTVARSFADL
ncbi:hypothetical protein, partial [Mesorhizobium sp.]|uniref:hypothetical protein n=1 Tax=Mesorhizobium sp. TaxID=1871066 RepID=UPI00257FE7D6